MPVISVGGIRDRVQTALSSEIGTVTYALRGGRTKTVNALVMNYGRSQTVGGVEWKQKPKSQAGLEVVITPQTQMDVTGFHSNQIGVEYTTTITLKQWDAASSVTTAATALIQQLGDLIDPGSYIRVPRDSGIDTVESQTFRIVHQIRS